MMHPAGFIALAFCGLGIGAATAQSSLAMGRNAPLTTTTGPFGVGREFLQLVDTTRTDSQSLRSDRHRELLAIVWYPALKGSAGSPYIPGLWLDSAAADLGFFGRRGYRPPSYGEARRAIEATASTARDSVMLPPGSTLFPVVLFSPGNNTSAIYYSALAEELASHGYVVVGNVPVGWARSVTFLDGRVMGNHPYRTLDLWVGDLHAILDWLQEWNDRPGNLLRGRLDLSRIGAYGHSAGANAVEVLAARDPRVKALALLDPGITDSATATPKPTLLALAENRAFLGRPGNDSLVAQITRERAAYERHLTNGFWMTISGSDHMMFSDISAVPAFNSATDNPRELATAQAILVAFFQETLRGVRSNLIRIGDPSWPLLRVGR